MHALKKVWFYDEKIGRRINITYRYIASYCGISTSTVSKYLNAEGIESIKQSGGQRLITTATEDLFLVECYVKIIEDQHNTKDNVIQIVGGFIEITLTIIMLLPYFLLERQNDLLLKLNKKLFRMALTSSMGLLNVTLP